MGLICQYKHQFDIFIDMLLFSTYFHAVSMIVQRLFAFQAVFWSSILDCGFNFDH